MSALTDWLTAIADAIREKDGTTDPIDHADFPDRIEAIPQDSGGGEEGSWRPSDWPDIEAIVDADVQAGYTYKYIYLMADDYSYVDLSGGSAYKTSDGAFYTSATRHVWDTSQDFPCSEGYKTRWVIVYTASENQDVSMPYEALWVDSGSVKFGSFGFSNSPRLRGVTGEFQQLTEASGMFGGCCSLAKVPDILDLSQCYDASYMFAGCFALTKVPDVLDLSQATNVSGMFADCHSLTKVPDVLDLSQADDASGMFYGCYSLTKVPDVLDLSQITTSASGMFSDCHSLLKTPQLIVPPAGSSLNFSVCTRINADHRDSVAAFTGASLTGGMVFHLPTITNARKLTLNSTIKGLFTATEQTEIASHLTGKNWTLSWQGGGSSN